MLSNQKRSIFILLSIIVMSVSVQPAVAQPDPCSLSTVISSYVANALSGGIDSWLDKYAGYECQREVKRSIHYLEQIYPIVTTIPFGSAHEPCSQKALLSSFEAADLSDGIGMWSENYSKSICSDEVKTVVEQLKITYQAMTLQGINFDTVIDFDGENDYIEVANDPSLSLNIFTLEIWVFPREIKRNWQPIIAKTDGDSRRNYGFWFVPNTTQVHISFCGATNYNSHSPLPLSVWSHIALSYDGSHVAFFINGELDTSDERIKNGCATDATIWMGMQPNRWTAFNGRVAEARIWNIARNQDEIQRDMNLRLTGVEDGLVGYYPLDDTEDGIAEDLAGGHNGIVHQ